MPNTPKAQLINWPVILGAWIGAFAGFGIGMGIAWIRMQGIEDPVVLEEIKNEGATTAFVLVPLLGGIGAFTFRGLSRMRGRR